MRNIHKGLNSRTVGLLAESGMGVHYEYTTHTISDCPEPHFWWWVVRNRRGEYVGNVDHGRMLAKLGIEPQLRTETSRACSIGKSTDGKWYGWSHRAIYGFKIGDVVKEGDCCASSGYTDEYLAEHPDDDLSLPVGFKAKTEGDCQKMAAAFAESVS